MGRSKQKSTYRNEADHDRHLTQNSSLTLKEATLEAFVNPPRQIADSSHIPYTPPSLALSFPLRFYFRKCRTKTNFTCLVNRINLKYRRVTLRWVSSNSRVRCSNLQVNKPPNLSISQLSNKPNSLRELVLLPNRSIRCRLYSPLRVRWEWEE